MSTKVNPRQVSITTKYIEGWAKNEEGENYVLKIPYCKTYVINNTTDTVEELHKTLFRLLSTVVSLKSDPLLDRLYCVDTVAFHETGKALIGEWQCNGDESIFIKSKVGKSKVQGE